MFKSDIDYTAKFKKQGLLYSLFFYIFLLLPVLFSCNRSLRKQDIVSEFISFRESIIAKTSIKNKIISQKAGITGYYYLIDIEGIILIHPISALAGRDFSRYNFVKIITDKKRGCLIYNAQNFEYLIIFNRISDRDILCLTIPLSEITGNFDRCIRIN